MNVNTFIFLYQDFKSVQHIFIVMNNSEYKCFSCTFANHRLSLVPLYKNNFKAKTTIIG